MKFITSPEDMATLKQCISTPREKGMSGRLLVPILGSFGVPEQIKQTMQQYITISLFLAFSVSTVTAERQALGDERRIVIK